MIIVQTPYIQYCIVRCSDYESQMLMCGLWDYESWILKMDFDFEFQNKTGGFDDGTMSGK